MSYQKSDTLSDWIDLAIQIGAQSAKAIIVLSVASLALTAANVGAEAIGVAAYKVGFAIVGAATFSLAFGGAIAAHNEQIARREADAMEKIERELADRILTEARQAR